MTMHCVQQVNTTETVQVPKLQIGYFIYHVSMQAGPFLCTCDGSFQRQQQAFTKIMQNNVR